MKCVVTLGTLLRFPLVPEFVAEASPTGTFVFTSSTAILPEASRELPSDHVQFDGSLLPATR